MTKITLVPLLAGEGRGEEVDAVGVAPERLLLGRERLGGGPRLRRGGAVGLHGPRRGRASPSSSGGGRTPIAAREAAGEARVGRGGRRRRRRDDWMGSTAA